MTRMPGGGRKAIPTQIKLLTGNPGHQRLNYNEMKPNVCPAPSPPQFLNAIAQDEWRRITEALSRLGVLTEIDLAALATYCQSYGRWVEAEKAIAVCAEDTVRYSANGLLAITRTGYKANPLILIADRAMMGLVRICAEFGMTPSSRSRVHVNPRDEDKDPGEEYFNNRK